MGIDAPRRRRVYIAYRAGNLVFLQLCQCQTYFTQDQPLGLSEPLVRK